ncbi:SURF1 family protein [Pseudactinotalea sp.]|uniref:SURF1 family protein n=1 Tax=Pseudactinotalea sp. TaxID=1926260 RepID=UPI003B3AF2CA
MRDWVRAATTPRMLGIFALLLVGAVVCVRLGAWQVDRAVGAAEQQAAIEQAARENDPPVPIAEVVAPQTSFTQAMVGQRVEVTGVWEPDLAYWVPGRELDGRPGYLLLTAFREESTGALLPVVRGWVAEKDPAHLELPSGTATVMGFIDGSEAAETGGADGDEIDSVSAGALVNIWGGPIYSGYVILVSATPEAGAPGWAPGGGATLEAMPPPVVPSGGLNVRNLLYAAEWFVFGGFALFLWWRMVRDEVRVLRA